MINITPELLFRLLKTKREIKNVMETHERQTT